MIFKGLPNVKQKKYSSAAEAAALSFRVALMSFRARNDGDNPEVAMVPTKTYKGLAEMFPEGLDSEGRACIVWKAITIIEDGYGSVIGMS